jgi:hypothetical protein
MHLEGPWLSTTGKRKGKVKFASAEAKHKAEQLDREWKEIQKRWGVEAEDKKRKRALSAEPLTDNYLLKIPEGRSTAHIKSLGQDNGVADGVGVGVGVGCTGDVVPVKFPNN